MQMCRMTSKSDVYLVSEAEIFSLKEILRGLVVIPLAHLHNNDKLKNDFP